jgi:hypothetical protein
LTYPERGIYSKWNSLCGNIGDSDLDQIYEIPVPPVFQMPMKPQAWSNTELYQIDTLDIVFGIVGGM